MISAVRAVFGCVSPLQSLALKCTAMSSFRLKIEEEENIAAVLRARMQNRRKKVNMKTKVNHRIFLKF